MRKNKSEQLKHNNKSEIIKSRNKSKDKSENQPEEKQKKLRIKSLKLKMPTLSLRTFIAVSIVVLSLALLAIVVVLTTSFYKKQYLSEMETKADFQASVIADELKACEMSVSENEGLNDSIDIVATSIDGRIMVINSEYKIIKDSYYMKMDSYIINEDVIDVITGESQDKRVDYKDSIRKIYAVYGETGDIIGVLILDISVGSLSNILTYINNRYDMIYALAIILSIMVAVLIASISSKSIRNIGNQMEHSGIGHIGDDIDVSGFKEIRKVATSYNDVMKKLMEIDSGRQEFVSNVSHELKTPITSMKVLADSLVQNEEADLLMYKEFMNDIVAEVDRESEIITDLLMLVKTDKKSTDMNIEETSINELLDIILKRVTPLAELRGIEITYESYRDVNADVDKVKLSLALTNIIENAVKYNIDNGSIRVSLNADHKYFFVKVADTGVGIPDDCKDKVFERFYRVDKARSRDTGGTGLGLAITRNVIYLHKGTIKLYSQSGEGTTFTVKMPLRQVSES